MPTLQDTYIKMPFVPKKRMEKHRIAYTMLMRGDDFDVPTLLFYGVPFLLAKDTCEKIFKAMAGNVKNLYIDREHSCRFKNGKCYWRIAVTIVGLNEPFLTLKEFVWMFVSCMQRLCYCKIRHYRTETFLNL